MKSKNLGFTLVELLIVISLIAILSVAVIATINPVEQANKARDAQMQNDAMEIYNAYERYYASTGNYPWVKTGGWTNSTKLVFASNLEGFGIGMATWNCPLGNCGVSNNPPTSPGAPGILITSGEIKASMANKKAFNHTTASIDRYVMYKESGDGSPIHVCYIPKAKVNRQRIDLWCYGSNSSYVNLQNFNKDASTCFTETDLNATSWADAYHNIDKAIYICVP
jgi:prepilin-type N-terminal cleavage/methylation domain-containing protein